MLVESKGTITLHNIFPRALRLSTRLFPQDANGPIGLVSGNKVEKTPVELLPDQTVVKIDSGTDHLVCLTKKGEIFTLGECALGQLHCERQWD